MFIAFRLIATDIHSPITMEEIEHAKGVYPLNGFPGCMGIVLMVFILLGKCTPAGIHSRCKGKERYSIIAFNVVSSHKVSYVCI